MSVFLEVKPYLQSFIRTGIFLREFAYFKHGEGIPDQRYTVYGPDLISEGYMFVARVSLLEHMTVAELIEPSGNVEDFVP